MKGKFYESEYEEALIDLLQAEGWQYTNGGNIHRQLRESLLVEDLNVNDLHIYLQNRYPNLTDSDVTEVINYLRHVPGQTHFERLRNTFQLVRDGYRYTRHGDGEISIFVLSTLTIQTVIFSVLSISLRSHTA